MYTSLIISVKLQISFSHKKLRALLSIQNICKDTNITLQLAFLINRKIYIVPYFVQLHPKNHL